MREFDGARVDDDELRAAADGLFDAGANDRVVLRGIASGDEERARVLDVVE